MRSIIHTLRHDQRGSNVAQAAAVAILAAILIAALLGTTTRFAPAVDRAFTCVITALSGGGFSCGGQSTAGTPNTSVSDQQGATPENGGGRDGWGWTAGSVTVDLIPIAGEIKGLIEVFTGTDLVTGEELGWWRFAGLAGLVGLNEIKFLRYGDDVIEVGSDVVRRGDDVVDAGGDAARRGDDIIPPCRIGVAPTGKVPGLAKPMLAPSDCSLPNPSTLQNPSARRQADRMANSIDHHLTPSDLEGAWRDLHGNPVPRPGGGYWNHIGEVQNALQSLRNTVTEFKELLRDPSISSADRAIIQRYLSSASKTIDYVEEVINRDTWIPGTRVPVIIE
jgi:hypothetical protein